MTIIQDSKTKLTFVNSFFLIYVYNFIRRLLILKILKSKKENIRTMGQIESWQIYLNLSKKRRKNLRKKDLK